MKKALLNTTFQGKPKRIKGYVDGNNRTKFYLTKHKDKAYLGVKATDCIEILEKR